MQNKSYIFVMRLNDSVIFNLIKSSVSTPLQLRDGNNGQNFIHVSIIFYIKLYVN